MKYRFNSSGTGYIDIIDPNHPMSDSRGRVAHHRYVMSNHLGRSLLSSEIVHHIDGNKKNNVIENLEIVSRSYHAKLHQKDIVIKSKNLNCIVCSKIFRCYPYRLGKSKFCSHKCYSLSIKGKPKT